MMDIDLSLSYSQQQILDRLNTLDEWLESLGIQPRSNDRLHAAIGVVRSAAAASRRKQQTGLITPIVAIHNFVVGLTEAMEFWRIYEAFKTEPKETLADRLERAISGPSHPEQETPRNSDGRNMMFELAFAADWKMKGLDVSLQEPDLILKVGERTFYTACKRPLYAHSIRSNLRGAKEQLSNSLKPDVLNSFGLAAISTSRILNQGHNMFHARDMADKNMIIQLQRTMLEQNGIVRDGRVRFDMSDSRLCGVIFHISMPMFVGSGDQFSLLGVFAGYDTGNAEAFEALSSTMSSLYPA